MPRCSNKDDADSASQYNHGAGRLEEVTQTHSGRTKADDGSRYRNRNSGEQAQVETFESTRAFRRRRRLELSC